MYSELNLDAALEYFKTPDISLYAPILSNLTA